jgi:membrane protein
MIKKFKKVSRLLFFTYQNFNEDKCTLQASALSFITILSLIPFLAFLFAIAKGLGIQNSIQNLILNKIALGKEEITIHIIQYIRNTNLKALGSLGLIFLFLAVIRVIGIIELVFNQIWGVKTPRRITRKISDYISIAVLCPLLIFIGSFASSLANFPFIGKILQIGWISQAYEIYLKILPFFSIWLALCIFYMFMPNTKVNFFPAVLGAVITGTIWQCVQWGYVHFQVGVSKYNAIYGTFAALPILMLWIYLNWVIILGGAEFCWVVQNRKRFMNEKQIPPIEISKPQVSILLIILKEIVMRFNNGEMPVSEVTLSESLNIPLHQLRIVLDFLVANKILIEVMEPKRGYVFSKNPSLIYLNEIFGKIEGEINLIKDGKLKEILGKVSEERNDSLRNYSLNDLC